VALAVQARVASAQTTPTCASVAATTGATVVYIENGDTQEPLLKRLGQKLLANANIFIAYVNTGSCTLTPNLYNGTPLKANTNMSYIPLVGADGGAWDPSQPAATCTTDTANPTPVDVGISALFPASCALGGPDAGSSVGLINGPVQAYTFIAPTGSTQKAIWAEEAYYAFGFGNANKIPPWQNISYMFTRPATKSTLVATALNILVPPNKWQGTPEAASSDVVFQVANSKSTPLDLTIGILGDEVYDANRSSGVKVLAYRAYGQTHAYFPDSTDQSFDRQNVRDGHYTLWSPTVYITKVDGQNQPTNPAVKYIVDLVLGNESTTTTPDAGTSEAGATEAGAPDSGGPPGGAPIDGLGIVTRSGLTPDCAMHVTRATDGGPLSLYSPAAPCDCYFASALPGATGTPAGCTTCTSDTNCTGGKCRHGYCEAR
jgi:hypothetical protein